MAEDYVFNLRLPEGTIISPSTTSGCIILGTTKSEELTIYSFQTGNFINIWDGLYINDASSGSTIADYGADDTVTTYTETVFDVTLNDNSYVSANRDVSYDIIIYNYPIT